MVDLRLTEENIRWLLVSFALVSVSIFFSYYIFPSQTSILTISFVVIGLTPMLYKLIGDEEAIVAHKKLSISKKYGGILMAIITISIGMFLAFSFWYNVLPSDPAFDGVCSTRAPCREGVFELQSGYLVEHRSMEVILGLMLLCFLLSLFLGAGAILIITWDISVLVAGTAPGSMGFIAYIPQLLGFFLTGLSGALLSFAIVRHEWKSHSFVLVLRDSLALLAISALFLITSYFLLYIP